MEDGALLETRPRLACSASSLSSVGFSVASQSSLSSDAGLEVDLFVKARFFFFLCVCVCVCFLLHLFVEFSDVWEFSESLFIFCFVFSCFLVLRGAYIYI